MEQIRREWASGAVKLIENLHSEATKYQLNLGSAKFTFKEDWLDKKQTLEFIEQTIANLEAAKKIINAS